MSDGHTVHPGSPPSRPERKVAATHTVSVHLKQEERVPVTGHLDTQAQVRCGVTQH